MLVSFSSVQGIIKMDGNAKTRQVVNAASNDNHTDTNVDGHRNRNPSLSRASKFLHKIAIIPMKTKSRDTEIVIPAITASHKRKVVLNPDIGHIQTALRTRKKLMQRW